MNQVYEAGRWQEKVCTVTELHNRNAFLPFPSNWQTGPLMARSGGQGQFDNVSSRTASTKSEERAPLRINLTESVATNHL